MEGPTTTAEPEPELAAPASAPEPTLASAPASESRSPAPAPAPELVLAPAVAAISPPSAVRASPPLPKVTQAIPSLPPRPDVEVDRRPTHSRRRSRSPPTGPRHHHSTSSNRSPAQGTPAGPNLPARPEWGRRNTAHGGHQGTKAAETTAPAPAPTGFQPVIPLYQPSLSVTAEIEVEVRCSRPHDTLK